MEPLEKLKLTRAGNRGVVTKLFAKIEEARNDSTIGPESVITNFERIIKKQTLLEELSEQILELTKEDIEGEIMDSEEYSVNLETKIKVVRKFIDEIQAPLPSTTQSDTHIVHNPPPPQSHSWNIESDPFVPSTSYATAHDQSNENQRSVGNRTYRPSSSHEQDNRTYRQPPSHEQESIYRQSSIHEPRHESSQLTAASYYSHSSHRLPKLTLPTFDGDTLQWQSFWDSFESAVHLNPTLTNVQKFNYLKAQLEKEALQSITGFALTNANYEEAVDVLKERFGETDKIISNYLQALLEIPRPRNDVKSLKLFYNNMEGYVRGLEALGESQETYGKLLVPMILKKLPGEMRIQLAREHRYSTWELRHLRKCILEEIKIMEKGQENDEVHRVPTTSSFHTGTRPKSRQIPANARNRTIENRPCVFCHEIHSPTSCTKVVDVEARTEIVKRDRLCFNCLGKHRIHDCKSNHSCRNCNKRHHTCLCTGNQSNNTNNSNNSAQRNNQQRSNNSSQRTTNATSVNLVNDNKDTEVETSILYSQSAKSQTNVLLKTAVAPVGSKSLYLDTNILFDEGAQRSFITEQLARKLNLQVEGTETMQLSAFGGSEKDVRSIESTTVYLQSQNGKKRIPIKALIVPMIAMPLQNHIRHIDDRYKYLRGLKLAHPIIQDTSFEIELLVGADYYWDIVEDHIVRGDGPTAVKSKIGYLLSGPIRSELDTSRTKSITSSIFNILTFHKPEELNLERFWKLESIGINSREIEESDDDYLKTYQENSIELRGNKYFAKLPWKQEHEELPSNYIITKKRTEGVIKRLSQNPELLTKYGNIIAEQERRGFIEKVDDNEVDKQNVHYIPHHPIRKESSTTPIRIVYDCSCRQSARSPSLNDCLSDMPPKLNDLTKIIMRFRVKPVAITTDIEKAFLHVGLHEDDRDYTRFLWLSNPADPTSSLQMYRFKSVLFGATSSPFMLDATLLKHFQQSNSTVGTTMERDLYVDNIISSVQTENEAIDYFYESRRIMSAASFNLRCWSSNSEKLRQIATEQTVLDKDRNTKVLGMLWDNKTDTLKYPKREIPTSNPDIITKREILRHSSQIYDPLGFLSPVTIRAKTLLQDLWKGGFDWDQPVPEVISKTWINLARDIEHATETVIPRCYFTTNSKPAESVLHIFCDASPKAYGSAAYLCKGDESNLVMAKTRVAPVKDITLPQLELMAAVIGARLATHIQSTLECANIVFWSDSSIVLHWLKSTKPLKRFIANRAREINELTNNYEWRYCPTESNPSDLVTRGITAEEYKESGMWWSGPHWITDRSKWPKSIPNNKAVLATFTEDEDNREVPNDNDHASNIGEIIDISRYGSLRKLIRVTAYVQRFVKNCRQDENHREISALTTDEIDHAVRIWISHSQESTYSAEITALKDTRKRANKTSRIRQLGLYLDEFGLLRCNGRIHNAPIPEQAKFPYLLPANHPFTTLIVMDSHEHLLHSGLNATLTYIRQSYWIPTIRQRVKKILHRCVTCRKCVGKSYNSPESPPLPKMRLQEAPPFTVTGVDYTGALYVRSKDGTLDKSYICLFTCASTRAVHLEVVTDLTEHSFILAFRRFVSRKSLPRILVSDNATTFIAGSDKIKRLCESETLKETLSTQGVEWRFIPKRAPWYGGFWERLIALTKTSLKKVLGRSQIDIETLRTIVTEIETILNDRPLTYPSSDIKDCDALTPAHLLYGRRILTLPYPRVEFDELSDPTYYMGHSEINKSVKRQTLLIQDFWKRWKQEYVTSLREYHRNSGNNEQSIKVGDIVQIHNESPRVNWKIGKVIELSRGNDGLVRSARIQTNTGETTRPIVKLYPLEVTHSETNISRTVENEKQNSIAHESSKPRRQASLKARENIRRWTNNSTSDDEDDDE